MKKKVFSKSMSWILSVVMAFGVLVFTPIENAEAYTSHSRDEAVAWARSKIGSKIDMDGYPTSNPYQCVDLIMAYYQYLGVSRVSGNGCDYSHNSLPSGWTRIQNTASFVPNPGDIVVWTDEGWKNGHVAIFLSGNTSNFTSIDQNWPQGSEVKEVYHSSYKYVWGVIRPDFTSNPDPAPNTFHGLSKVDRGTNFYGLIIRNENWAHLADVNGNVEVKNDGNIVWYFTKTSDGGYKIKNVATGKYLDVNGAYDKDDNNVQTWEPNDSAAQVWYIYGPWSGEYVFKPKCTSDKVLNVYGPTGDATTWTFNPDDKDMRFALWDDISTYTVSYNMNGGSGSIGNQTKVQYSPLTLSSTRPTRSGYTFVGWNTNKNATTAQYQPGGKYTDNNGATLYAIWKANTYTIAYNANGGSGSMNSSSIYYGQTLTLPECKFTKIGYNCVGYNVRRNSDNKWYTNEKGWITEQEINNTKSNKKVYSIKGSYGFDSSWTGGASSNDTFTFYPVWKINTYTVSYNMNGGSGSIGNQTKTYGQDLTLSSTKPTRPGYDFVGWNTSASATTAQYQPGGKYTANNSATLYAIWKAKQVTVTFYRNQNGSDNTTATQTFTYGVNNQSFSNKNWSKDGHSLLGWSENRNATDKQYSTNSGVDWNWIAQRSPKVTVYAVWKPNTYTVSYNMNGGSGSIGNQIKTYGQDLTLSSTKPTRTGYDFVGWNTNKDATTAQYQPSEKYKTNSSATLYAIWKANTYTISYNMNGGSGSISNQIKTYGQDLTLSSTKPTRTGFTFVGWNTNKDATAAQYQPGGKYTANSGATLYAIWKANSYTIAYDANGGNSSISSVTVLFGNSFNLPGSAFTKTGHTLSGYNVCRKSDNKWYVESQGWVTESEIKSGNSKKLYGTDTTWNLNSSWFSTNTTTDTYTFYAVWKANQYIVSYSLNGGIGEAIPNQTKIYDQDLLLYSGIPVRTGYDFVGWNTDPQAKTVQYKSGDKYTQNTNIKLYAVWKLNLDKVKPVATGTFNGHTYEYYNETTNWYRADEICGRKGGHLVTINSKAENEFLLNITSGYSGSAWTGGVAFTTKNWWWVTNEPFDYKNWADQEKNDNANYAMIYSLSDGTWSELNSWYYKTATGFICEYGETVNVSEYNPVYKTNYEGHEYCFFDKVANWESAVYVCEQLGGHLVIIDNKGENDMILSEMKAHTSKTKSWIGISDHDEEGVWKDVKGNPLQYTNWKDNEPDNFADAVCYEDFGVMESDGLWADYRTMAAIYHPIGFVCEFDDLCTANGHSYVNTVVAPTTTEQGYTLHTCSICGHSYKDAYTNKLLDNTSTLSSNAIKLGAPLTVNASATGGTGDYEYAVFYKKADSTKWTTAQNFGTNSTVKIKPAKAVKYDVLVKAKDSSGKSAEKTLTVDVFEALKNTSTVVAENIGFGDTITVKAKSTGGLGDCTYAVYYKKSFAEKWSTLQKYSDNTIVTFKPASATTYDVMVKVKDSRDVIVKKTFTVSVTKPENTSTIAATEIKLGNTINISCSATGSSGFYQYAVLYKKASSEKWTTSQNYSPNNSIAIKPASRTTYNICVKVKDNFGNISKKYFEVTVK